jgi:hypothetical protein
MIINTREKLSILSTLGLKKAGKKIKTPVIGIDKKKPFLFHQKQASIIGK